MLHSAGGQEEKEEEEEEEEEVEEEEGEEDMVILLKGWEWCLKFVVVLYVVLAFPCLPHSLLSLHSFLSSSVSMLDCVGS